MEIGFWTRVLTKLLKPKLLDTVYGNVFDYQLQAMGTASMIAVHLLVDGYRSFILKVYEPVHHSAVYMQTFEFQSCAHKAQESVHICQCLCT